MTYKSLEGSIDILRIGNEDILSSEIYSDEQLQLICKDGAKLKFFENLIPGIVEKIHNSKYPAAQLSSGKVAPALTEYVEDYSEAGDDMDQEPPEVPVKAKRVQRDMPGMDDEPPKGYDARTAKAAQKDSLYPYVNDDGEVDDVPF